MRLGVILASIITATLLTVFPPVMAGGHVEAKQSEEPPQPPKTLYTLEELTMLVYASADKYNAPRNELLTTVKCEAKQRLIDGVIFYDSSAQSDHYWKGVREESYGFAMWNLPSANRGFDGQPITYEQATNPSESLDLMAWYFSRGVKSIWTCYRLNY